MLGAVLATKLASAVDRSCLLGEWGAFGHMGPPVNLALLCANGQAPPLLLMHLVL